MSESHEIKGIIGDDTPVTICFDYEPPQKEILAPNERAQPAEDARITVGAVLIGNDDLSDCLNARAMEKVEDQCWQFMRFVLWSDGNITCNECGEYGTIFRQCAPEGCSIVANNVLRFLLGEAPLFGRWFHEQAEEERGAFWWRKYLPRPAAPESGS